MAQREVDGKEESSPENWEGRIWEIRHASAEDLRLLAFLHGSELTKTVLSELKRHSFKDALYLILSSSDSVEALNSLDKGLGLCKADDKSLEILATSYADIYLTHKLKVSPYESPWLDEDGLVNGESMFQVRSWYKRYGLRAEKWRERGDDHLSLELTFVAHLLTQEKVGLGVVGQFLDEHLLRWLELFAHGVRDRCSTSPIYRALAMLTLSYVEELRTLVERVTGEPRVCFDSVSDSDTLCGDGQGTAYHPDMERG